MLKNKMKNKLTNQRKVIENYGFGSLLLFDKCFVPNNFVKRVARLVDYKSGDIVLNGKIISLTKESVHNVLGIPLDGRSFPTDITNGKSAVLKKFNKESIPSVEFYTNKLQSKEEVMSDEDTFICFILIALNSFLCSNASLIPSQKFFGIFDDISNCKEFDWCGYVLSWLLKHIKTFNKSKTKAGKQPGTLGGCLYYLPYLVRGINIYILFFFICYSMITVWKGNMIQTYSNFDIKSPGVYGFRPILDFSETCYAKVWNLLSLDCSYEVKKILSIYDYFLMVCKVFIFSILNRLYPMILNFWKKFDFVSGCKLPTDLKTSICKAIEKHTFSLGLQVNLDVTSISSLPKHIFNSFTKLLQHASSVESRMKNIVLDVLKLVTESPHESASASPQPYLSRDSSTGGKLPLHGPRRVVKSSTLFHSEFQIAKQKIYVSNSELKNYKSLCSLASSKFSNEDVVCLGKVRCTFWSLGESLKPGGFVNPFVISTYCYSLYLKPTSTFDTSKSHFFFANIGETLLKESEQVNEEILARAFKGSSIHQPLHHSNNLFFPTLYNNHWFVFMVNIKDHNFIFLDSLHHKDHEFLEIVSNRMVPIFQLYWDHYVQVNMNFDEYDIVFPLVPQQPLDNTYGSFFDNKFHFMY
ncbi:hypothetical protein SETIT_9G294100v2 [Setaria italica]|uniref:Ubiquitin-like protease family profile domain-containing protein n=1 Tax=Setaria italica TaxID=4555 RepID=K4AIL2_SETIT|nr:hypothetical protein SETIT_9G294100v2 [Setaria italica]